MNGENKKPSATSDKNKPKQKRKEKKKTHATQLLRISRV